MTGAWIEMDVDCENCKKKSKIKVYDYGNQDKSICDDCFEKGHRLNTETKSVLGFKCYRVISPPIYSKRAYESLINLSKNTKKDK